MDNKQYTTLEKLISLLYQSLPDEKKVMEHAFTQGQCAGVVNDEKLLLQMARDYADQHKLDIPNISAIVHSLNALQENMYAQIVAMFLAGHNENYNDGRKHASTWIKENYH